jgi:serine/threonine-protein phosphatase 6 regulatory subunit 3
MARLIDRLSPSHSSDMHVVISELIKSIISMAAPSPGAGITEGSQVGPASNRFARELARRSNVQKLVDYIVTEFDGNTGSGARSTEMATTQAAEDLFSDEPTPTDSASLPSFESCTSSVSHSICIIVELIRQNNSDYFEPYLFHTLRNRLIQIQQHLSNQSADDARNVLESTMTEMVDRIGVVHLGAVLDLLSDKLEQLQKYLIKPRSLVYLSFYYKHVFLR